MVLCCGTDESDAACRLLVTFQSGCGVKSTNINLFHGFGNSDINLCNSVLEWIKIADDIVHFVNLLRGKVLFV
jgi:hypothetical protein